MKTINDSPSLFKSALKVVGRVFWVVLLTFLFELVVVFALLVAPNNIYWVREHILKILPITLVLAGGTIILARGVTWLFRRDSSHFRVWASVVLVSLVALYYSYEKWTGKQAWAKVQQEMASRGERPGLSFVIPAPVEKELDAAQSPIFEPLRNFDLPQNDKTFQGNDQQGINRLQSLHPSKWSVGWPRQITTEPNESDYAKFATNADLEAVRVAVERPYARFNKAFSQGSINQIGTQAGIFQSLCQVFTFQASSCLKRGEPEKALEDIHSAFRICQLEYQQPFPFIWGSSEGLTLSALQPVYDGLAARSWNDVQLQELQSELKKLTPSSHFGEWCRNSAWFHMDLINQCIPTGGRRAEMNWLDPQLQVFLRSIRMIYPTGWSYQDQADIYRSYTYTLDALDPKQLRAFPRENQRTSNATRDLVYLTIVAPKINEIAQDLPARTTYMQTCVNLAYVACALERYRLAQGGYPETLEKLVPDFLTPLPHDMINGQPLHYRLASNAHYALYSVGWNQKDDNGITHLQNWGEKRVDPMQGDWVWEYPREKTNEPSNP